MPQGSVIVKFFIAILIILGTAALSAGVTFGEIYLTKKKNVLAGLIPAGAVAVVSYIVLIIMSVASAEWYTKFITFYILQIPVIVGVVMLVLFRKKYRRHESDENARQARLQNARRIEGEKQARLNTLLLGFRCAESSMKVEGQREVVLMSRDGKTAGAIASEVGASADEVERILSAFDRYVNRVDTDEATSVDRILTPEQEESIVNYLVNSTPAENNLSASALWNRTTARLLASNLLGVNISTRMISAYLNHWGLTVPEKQTIRARSVRPEVRSWLAGDYEKIRKKATDGGGELIWIYTVMPERLADVSVSVPKNPLLLCAVSAEGSVAFRVYDKDAGACFTDFVASLTALPGPKFYAIVNENYTKYMDTLGRDRRRALSDRIEFFSGEIG